jgi:hypothetical protein
MQRAAAEPEKPGTNALLVDEELQPLVLEPDEGALAFGDFGRGFQQRFATGLASLASAALRGVRVGGRLLKKAGGGIGRVANATVVGFRSPQPDADSDDEGSSTELLDKSATQRTLPSSARDDSQLLERVDDEASWVEFFGLLVVAAVEILRNASQILLQFLLVALAMMLLTILVDLLLPFEVAPEQAIKRSLSLATIAKQWYEFARGVLNGLGGVLNAFIPGWNSFSQYVFSQVVFFSVRLASRMISFFLDDMSDNASAGNPGNPDLFFAMAGNVGGEVLHRQWLWAVVPEVVLRGPFWARVRRLPGRAGALREPGRAEVPRLADYERSRGQRRLVQRVRRADLHLGWSGPQGARQRHRGGAGSEAPAPVALDALAHHQARLRVELALALAAPHRGARGGL